MSLTKYNPNDLTSDAPASWEAVQYWATAAARFQHASVAAQVMAGFALKELQKAHGTNQGKRTDLATSPSNLEKLDWPDLVKKYAGVSNETARKWMLMADGVRKEWKKLDSGTRLKALMSVPVSDWTDADSQLVSDSLHKAADGMTQIDFMRELGLAKMPQGSGARGGIGSVGGQQKLTMSEEVALRQEQAAADWAAIAQALKAYADKFLVFPNDLPVNAQIADLEQAINPRKAWLKQPVGRRDAAAISKMFKL